MKYNGFADIYFNPTKDNNCQAKACAIYVGMHRAGLWDKAMKNRTDFAWIVLVGEAWD